MVITGGSPLPLAAPLDIQVPGAPISYSVSQVGGGRRRK